MTESHWHRMLRGGSCINHPGHCRSAFRIPLLRGGADFNVSFRVACSAPGDHPIPLEETHG